VWFSSTMMKMCLMASLAAGVGVAPVAGVSGERSRSPSRSRGARRREALKNWIRSAARGYFSFPKAAWNHEAATRLYTKKVVYDFHQA